MNTAELIDTDVFIDHFRGVHRLELPETDRVAYSVVSRCELFAGRHVDEQGIRALLDPIEEVPVDRRVAESAGRLRRQFVDLRTPDALIAATALIAGFTLVTNNLRDFERITGLKIRRPRS